MRIGSVSVIIPEGRERGGGYVELGDGQVYTLRLLNHYYRRAADAQVSIDGKDLGTYRVDPAGGLILECSHLDSGRFTFCRAEGELGQQAGAAGVEDSAKGLLQVTFHIARKQPLPLTTTGGITRVKRSKGLLTTPDTLYSQHSGELSTEPTVQTTTSYDGQEEYSKGRVEAGVTGLTGTSGQNFVTVAELDYDPQEMTVISLRLVYCDRGVRPVAGVPRGNPVPDPVA